MEKDHMEIILEDIQSKFELLIEGHGSVVDRLDRLDTKSDRIESRFDRLEVRMDSLDVRMARQEVESANRHKESMDKLSEVTDDLAAHRVDTEFHSGYQVRERPTED